MIDVTVIIPCRDQCATLGKAVDSGFNAGATEVLVYFDDSVIDWNLVNQLRNAYNIPKPRFFIPKLQLEGRVGVSIARNWLIENCHTDFIIPLDADDELLCIPEPPLNRWCYGGWIEHYEDGHEETFTAPPPAMIRQKPLCHATMMFHKSLWQEVGGYDPDFAYAEDYALQCAFSTIEKPTHLDYPLYRRYIGKNERTEKAKQYWNFYHQLAKTKWPSVFA